MTGPKRQRGYTLLLTLLVLLVGGASLFVAARDPGSAARATKAVETASGLEAVRDAVIAYALSRDPDPATDDDIPGALPCIDDNMPPDGVTDQTTCWNTGNDQILTGWLPWRTIDASRESGAFWYVMDSDFRQDKNPPTMVGPINVSIPGSLQLNGQSGFAALIIDPGDPMDDTQTDRGTAGATIDDYLEGDNADGDSSFEDCSGNPNCNDRIVGISVDRLLHAVQRRALAEMRAVLQDHYSDEGHYPFAADITGGLSCDPGTFRGRVPFHDGTCGPGESLAYADFDSAATWVHANDWDEYIVYAVDPDCTSFGGTCSSPTLELENSTGLAVVLGAAGTELSSLGQDRSLSASRSIDDYLDSAENTDGDDTFDDLPFVENQDNDALIGFTP